MEKKVRKLKGNPPDIGKELAHHENWRVFRRPNAVDEWISLKLFTTKPVPRKGNYWLSWNQREKRFAQMSDYHALRLHAPAVHAWLLGVCQALPKLPPYRG